MPKYTYMTTLKGKEAANDLGLALENLENVHDGVDVFVLVYGSRVYDVRA